MIFCANKKLSKSNRLVVSLMLLSLINVACKETEATQSIKDSELIQRINAVQEQVMAQGNMSDAEEQAILSLCGILTQNDGLANYDPNQRLILKDVDMAPIFPGCDQATAEETRICFNNNIASFIRQEFNLSLSKDLNLLKPKRVDVFFVIDQTGNLTGMKVRDSEVTIQAEILRVLRKMPVMKPAKYKGEDVSVLCSMVMEYGNSIKIDVTYIPERPTS